MPLSTAAWPFILHILTELPAAFAFALFPSATLSTPQPHAHALIRQYALLLFSTNVIAAVFIFRHGEAEAGSYELRWIERWVACSLALYHVGPLIRAGCKVWKGTQRRQHYLARPWIHLIVHLVCLAGLASHSLAESSDS